MPAAQPAVPAPARPVAPPAVDVDVDGAAAPDPLAQLEVLADELAALDESRRALLTSRDALVRAERSRGITWDVLAAACRTSPQALMKRHAGKQ